MALIKQGGRVDYNYKEFMLDTEEDISKIDVQSCIEGSSVYIISTGNLYILNSKKEWVLQ